ncbi:MAG TPA: hypothetical protein VHF22_13420 [Planctomycetota bacterium]|nr:hypothetical protein [Planctomycetota bacterium]
MDPLSAKVGAGGLSNLSGELSKSPAKPGSGGKFEQVRMDKQSDPMARADRMLDNFQKTGSVHGVTQSQGPSMAQRVAARDGISFQPNLQFAQFGNVQSTTWAPQQVHATGQTQQVAGAVQGLNEGQARLESIIGELKSGKQYSQQELLGLQAEVNVLSEQLQMSTKLVDSAMQSIKSVMQQQV